MACLQALDERRARFKVNHWSRVRKYEDKGSRKREKLVLECHEDTWREPDDVETDVQEVWFAGGHVRKIDRPAFI